MIAFCLDRLGLDPAFLIGGEIPQLGGNAGAGEGWLVVEGDESDRSVAALRPEIAVLLNVDLDHHATYRLACRGRGAVRAVARAGAARRPGGRARAGRAASSPCPGEHNRRNAAAALAALELAGVPRADAERVIVDFRGAGRRLERKGEANGVVVLDSYAHHPAELAADLAAVAERGGPRARALPAAPLLAHPPPRARVRSRARGCRRRLRDRRLRGARGAAAGRQRPADRRRARRGPARHAHRLDAVGRAGRPPRRRVGARRATRC